MELIRQCRSELDRTTSLQLRDPLEARPDPTRPTASSPASCGCTTLTSQPLQAATQPTRLVAAAAPSTAVDGYDLIDHIHES